MASVLPQVEVEIAVQDPLVAISCGSDKEQELDLALTAKENVLRRWHALQLGSPLEISFSDLSLIWSFLSAGGRQPANSQSFVTFLKGEAAYKGCIAATL